MLRDTIRRILQICPLVGGLRLALLSISLTVGLGTKLKTTLSKIIWKYITV
jgi:hypothetical protein